MLALSRILSQLDALAPLALAEPWDNVGLLLEPPRFRSDAAEVEQALLTIDLTPAVLEEAVAAKADLIIAYHPPIFSGQKRLTFQNPTQALVLSALEAGIAIYSPHTALDAAAGGMNDWLAAGAGAGHMAALLPSDQGRPRYKLIVFVPEENAEALRSALCKHPSLAHIGEYSECTFASTGEGTFLGSEQSNPVLGERGSLTRVREVRLEMLCEQAAIALIPGLLKQHHPYEEPAWEVQRLEPLVDVAVGMGRSLLLTTPAPLNELVQRYKEHLGVPFLRVAASSAHERGVAIQRIHVCAGSGGEVFQKASPADLYVTGELRHHDILALVARGASVIVSDHSNSERGYLPNYRRRILENLPELRVLISESDRDPLRVV
ncbi:MAG: Nif3-like dinuclear metal center hexameric protein [Polyangiaceae bacterium]|nr:Nif3-like dinuclear metal center hexameric protein [Polyangiaceae bacterium]